MKYKIFIFLIFIFLIFIFEKIFFKIKFKNKKIFLENIFLKNKNKNLKTPKILIQTHYDKKIIPKKVYDNINKYAPDHKHIIFDDKECIDFLKKNYNQEIVNRFKNLKLGCHKSDLFRYCWLYKNGGVYLDIKIVLLKNLKDIFNDDTKLYTVKSAVKNSIFQGIISTPPNNPIFKNLITKILIRSDLSIKLDYHIFTKDFFDEFKEGKLFKEVCNKKQTSDLELSRYNNKCAIYNGSERLFITRYPDYPWK